MSKNRLAAPRPLLPWRWQSALVPSLCILAGILIIPWSASVFGALYHFLRSLPLSSFFSTVVQFSSFAVMISIACLIFLLDKPRAIFLPYFLCALLAGGAVCSVMKQIAGRSRPEWSVMMSKNKLKELTAFSKDHGDFQIPLTKVDNWFGLRLNRPFFMDRYTSFPSGHACGAFTIAAFLVVMYPRARKFWITAAIACALSRVYGERHYLEDIMVGGAIGWLCSYWAFSWQWPLVLGQAIAQRFGRRAVLNTAAQPGPGHENLGAQSAELVNSRCCH